MKGHICNYCCRIFSYILKNKFPEQQQGQVQQPFLKQTNLRLAHSSAKNSLGSTPQRLETWGLTATQQQ